MNRLKDKIAVITGGAGGIGLATAQKFLEEGAKVLLVDLQEDQLKEAMKTLDSQDADYFVADVSKSAQVKGYVNKALEKYGRIDIFFNNAGVEGSVKPITEYPEEEFDQVIAVNIKGVWLGLKYVMPVMEKNGGGSIIITSSVAGLIGMAKLSGYTATKHAAIGIMKCAAMEGGPKNIRVNTVNPGPVDNRMMRSVEDQLSPGKGEEVKKGFEGKVPLGRYAHNEDIANLVAFLADDEASYINGCVYPVDGGYSAG